jgi:hypothetical protein
MHQALQGATFHLEYLLPSSRGGETNLDFNHPRRLLIRQAEEVFGLFSP